MNKLSKEELIELYEKFQEDTLRKLGVYDNAREAYEGKQKMEVLKKERIEKAKALVKEAMELLGIYKFELRVSARGVRIVDNKGSSYVYNNTQKGIGRVKRGLKTQQSQYRIPILQSLVDLGGSGEVNEVLKQVYERMKGVLKPIDLEKVLSGQIRWVNTARWERAAMLKEGLLQNYSPRSIWEISDKGRIYLNDNIKE